MLRKHLPAPPNPWPSFSLELIVHNGTMVPYRKSESRCISNPSYVPLSLRAQECTGGTTSPNTVRHSYLPRAVDAAIVDWLKEFGATARHLYLGDWGVEGNGHMIMLEQNSDEVASPIIQWIRSEQ